MKVVIGVDSGGTTTRALAVSLEGDRVAYAEGGGGNPSHDAASRENVREAIRRAGAGHEVVRVVAGIAGYNGPEDDAWARESAGGGTVVNDAVVAHAGALEGRPGIVSIQGTGSTIHAILEDGRHVRNAEFFHYANGGAVMVGIRAVQRMMVYAGAAREVPLRDAAFALWGVGDLAGLRAAVERQFELGKVERSRRYGELARRVTAAAEGGWPVCASVCNQAAEEIVEGIRLLGPLFSSAGVEVALVGACVQSAPIRRGVASRLARAREKAYRIVEPAVPPAVGAVIMALRQEGIELGAEALRELVAPKHYPFPTSSQ